MTTTVDNHKTKAPYIESYRKTIHALCSTFQKSITIKRYSRVMEHNVLYNTHLEFSNKIIF